MKKDLDRAWTELGQFGRFPALNPVNAPICPGPVQAIVHLAVRPAVAVGKAGRYPPATHPAVSLT